MHIIIADYTPSIYAKGYILYVFPFVSMFVQSLICLFLVLFDSLRPSQQYFINVGMGLPGLNQY